MIRLLHKRTLGSVLRDLNRNKTSRQKRVQLAGLGGWGWERCQIKEKSRGARNIFSRHRCLNLPEVLGTHPHTPTPFEKTLFAILAPNLKYMAPICNYMAPKFKYVVTKFKYIAPKLVIQTGKLQPVFIWWEKTVLQALLSNLTIPVPASYPVFCMKWCEISWVVFCGTKF